MQRLWGRENVSAPILFVVKDVWEIWQMEAQRNPWRETGGILMGYWVSRDEVVLTHATGPGPHACRKRRSLEMDGDYCQGQLEIVYASSAGALTFLGDWHTHPVGPLHPSQRDRSTLRDIGADPNYRTEAPLMIIYGPTWSATAFRFWKWLTPPTAAAYLLTDKGDLAALQIWTIPSIPAE